MWDVLLQGLIGLAAGAAVGYGVYKIVEALSRTFAELWENLVAAATEIWGYVTEATKSFFASLAQFLDNSWSEIESYLRQELGYARDWIIALFKEGSEAFMAFINPEQKQDRSLVSSLGVLENQNVQLPSIQNPVVVRSSLQH